MLETVGFRQLLKGRGQVHHVEAQALAAVIAQAADARANEFRTWIGADPAVIELLRKANATRSGIPGIEAARQDQELEREWPSLAAADPAVTAITGNPAAESLARYRALHPELAEILLTDSAGMLAAATGKASDLIQSDEGWWQTGSDLRENAHHSESLHFDASSRVFSSDVVLRVFDGTSPSGVVKITEDISTLFSRLPFSGEAHGERWYLFLADGRILASSQPGTPGGKLPDALAATIREKRCSWTIGKGPDGKERMFGFTPIGNPAGDTKAFVAFSSLKNDVVSPVRANLRWYALATALLVAAGSGAAFVMIRRGVLVPLEALGRAARSISASAKIGPETRDRLEAETNRRQAEDDLRKIQAIHTGDEVESLAGDLAVMTKRVLQYQRELESEVAAKTSVIREDLEMAREFQQALLPSEYPVIPPPAAGNPLRLAFAHFYQPASTVGGDFFDIIELDDNRAGILIADVMGHGARSALVTAILRALVKNTSARTADPGEFLRELNKHLHEVIARSGQTLFVTAFLLVLDTRQGTARWSVAGHPAPLRVKRGSGKDPLPLWDSPRRQPALGLVPDFFFRSEESGFSAGDVFLLFTDGIYEAENLYREAFGMERLISSFDQALDGPIAAMPAKIVCDVMGFQHRNYCDDDICVVAVEALRPLRPDEA